MQLDAQVSHHLSGYYVIDKGIDRAYNTKELYNPRLLIGQIFIDNVGRVMDMPTRG
jgi:hypothetical protein